jgi:hypothetical protein
MILALLMALNWPALEAVGTWVAAGVSLAVLTWAVIGPDWREKQKKPKLVINIPEEDMGGTSWEGPYQPIRPPG